MNKLAMDGFIIKTILIFLFFLNFTLCKSPEESEKKIWVYNNTDIIGQKPKTSTSIKIDNYFDATMSMIGFVTQSTNNYSKFLEELESIERFAWRDADIRLFKFGTTIREINSKEFKNSNKKSFYKEPGVYERTNIDQVINLTDSSRVSIVITDLFQDEGDINEIVEQIKEKCFKRGIQVAILGIQSYFDGMVFDAGRETPSFPLKSVEGDLSTYRPFYVMMFGEHNNIEYLFNKLKNRLSFVDEDYFFVLNRYLIKNFELTLSKDKKCKSINKRANTEKYQNHYNFDLRKSNEGQLRAEIKVYRNTRTPDFNVDFIKTLSFRKTMQTAKKVWTTDSTLSENISLALISRNENVITATLNLNLPDPAGKYSFLTYFQVSSSEGLVVPQWINDFSTDKASPEKDANKTLNLKRFVENLILANFSIYQPKISKMYFTITKK